MLKLVQECYMVDFIFIFERFEEFSKPVDPKEVPDYLSVISHPMDLETMMVKVTDGKYHSALEFLQDINLIVENCLEYNPMKTNEDRVIPL